MDNAEFDRQIIQLSIVIISYNTINFTEDCLRSIYQEAINKYFEVIVLDNASADGSVARIADLFPQVRLIRGERITALPLATISQPRRQEANGYCC